MTNEYEDLEDDYEITILKDILTRSTVVVIVKRDDESGAEIHFGDNGNVWVAYIRNGNEEVPS